MEKSNSTKFLARALLKLQRRSQTLTFFSVMNTMRRFGHFSFTDLHGTWQKYVNLCLSESFYSRIFDFFSVEVLLFSKTDFSAPVFSFGEHLGSIAQKRYTIKNRSSSKSTSLACALSDSVNLIVQKRTCCAVDTGNQGHPHLSRLRNRYAQTRFIIHT